MFLLFILFLFGQDARVIRRNRGDVKLMKNVLNSVTGPDGELYKVYSYDDLVAKDVYTKINQLLVAPSRDGDVSMFFFASTGIINPRARNMPAACGARTRKPGWNCRNWQKHWLRQRAK